MSKNLKKKLFVFTFLEVQNTFFFNENTVLLYKQFSFLLLLLKNENKKIKSVVRLNIIKQQVKDDKSKIRVLRVA